MKISFIRYTNEIDTTNSKKCFLRYACSSPRGTRWLSEVPPECFIHNYHNFYTPNHMKPQNVTTLLNTICNLTKNTLTKVTLNGIRRNLWPHTWAWFYVEEKFNLFRLLIFIWTKFTSKRCKRWRFFENLKKTL